MWPSSTSTSAANIGPAWVRADVLEEQVMVGETARRMRK
jgi:hypothetical protein